MLSTFELEPKGSPVSFQNKSLVSELVNKNNAASFLFTPHGESTDFLILVTIEDSLISSVCASESSEDTEMK